MIFLLQFWWEICTLPYSKAGNFPSHSDRFNDLGWFPSESLRLLFFHFFHPAKDPETGRIPQVFSKEKSGSATHVDHFLGVSRFFGSTFFHVFSPWHVKGDLMAVISTTYTSLSMPWLEEIVTPIARWTIPILYFVSMSIHPNVAGFQTNWIEFLSGEFSPW